MDTATLDHETAGAVTADAKGAHPAAPASSRASVDAADAGLRVEGLRHVFGAAEVVKGVSFHVPPGEVHSLMGPSGCGKTTTLRLIAGLEELQTGTVALDGEVLARAGSALPPERRRIGLLFQDLALFPHLSVAGNVAFGISKLPRAQRNARVERLLSMVGMAGHSDKYPHQLSGGEQQRVALARALAPEPKLMLLDEAFNALDASLRPMVREEALELLREAGVPTLLVTHDPEEAVSVSDRVHVMQHGRIVQSDAPEALYKSPANEFVANFFGSTLRFDGASKGGLVKTPLGFVAAPQAADDEPIAVVFRADAVHLRPDYRGDGHAGHVVACRRMGPTCSLTLKLDNGPTIDLRKPAATPHHVGMRVGFEIDQRYAFVFKQDALEPPGDPCPDD